MYIFVDKLPIMRSFLRVLLPVICLALFPVKGRTQSMDELMGRLAELESRVMDEVDRFHREVDKRYHELLGQPWEHTKEEAPNSSPFDKDVPVDPHAFDPSRDAVKGRVEIDSDFVEVESQVKPRGSGEEFPGKAGLDDCEVEITVNGIEVTLRCPKTGSLKLGGTSEKEVASAWAELASFPFDNLLRDLSRVREVLKMSDWSLVCAIDGVSEALYGTEDSPEAVLFQAYVLNRFGFLLSLGRSGDGALHKLLSVDMGLIGFPAYTIEGRDYYLFDKSAGSYLSTVRLGLNGERPLHIMMNTDELFYSDFSDKKHYVSQRYPEVSVEVASDKSRMAYYDGYPDYFSDGDVKTSFYYHAMIPLSDEVRDMVYPVLRQKIRGKSELEAVNMLLNFVQTAFNYEYDNVMWGKERYLYADEIWYYDFSDCEDRSILFSRLVRDLVGLKVALVYWPGHLSCAVRFSSPVSGTYFNVDGDSYVSCDPTFIGAGVGAVMDAVKNLPATLIML